MPAVPLAGVDAFHVQLRKPPRAGLVFDLDSGEVLWRRRPAARAADREPHEDHDRAAGGRAERSPHDPVRITKAALDYTGSGVGLLPQGQARARSRRC